MNDIGINCEFWLPVAGRAAGYPYEVSDHGRVRRSKPGKNTYPGKILNQYEDKDGYNCVRLYSGKYVDKERRHFPVHSLVADTFLGPAPGPIGVKWGEWNVNHKNGDKTNSRIGNLEWRTVEGNQEHASKEGLTPNSHYSREFVRKIWCLYYEKELSMQQVADKLGIPKPSVKCIVQGRTRREDTKDLGEPNPRKARGQNHGASKITEEDVREIRRLGKTGEYTQKEIGKMFGLSQAQIGRILRRKAWAHIDE